MEKTIEHAVGRVIESMRANLGEELTVDDMARTAMFSKFHFSRLFQRATGVSPGRFLSAMRLHEAKLLLVETSLSVTEVSHQVGYTSVGTFSSRFTKRVGVSPSTYRQLGGFVERWPEGGTAGAGAPSATVSGEVRCAGAGSLGLVFLGLFADPVPRGQPVRCTVLHRAGPYRLDDVPHGTWHLLAQSVAAGAQDAAGTPAEGGPTLCIGSGGVVRVGAATTHETRDVCLSPAPDVDPSLLQALLDVRSVALTVGAS